MNYHYSIDWEPGANGTRRWYAQMLRMPEEETLRIRWFYTKDEAQAQLNRWKEKYGK